MNFLKSRNQRSNSVTVIFEPFSKCFIIDFLFNQVLNIYELSPLEEDFVLGERGDRVGKVPRWDHHQHPFHHNPHHHRHCHHHRRHYHLHIHIHRVVISVVIFNTYLHPDSQNFQLRAYIRIICWSCGQTKSNTRRNEAEASQGRSLTQRSQPAKNARVKPRLLKNLNTCPRISQPKCGHFIP